jgi:hypothetical protein
MLFLYVILAVISFIAIATSIIDIFQSDDVPNIKNRGILLLVSIAVLTSQVGAITQEHQLVYKEKELKEQLKDVRFLEEHLQEARRLLELKKDQAKNRYDELLRELTE